MNYYQHHIGDFIRDTARLSNDQCMAYLRMIWRYYDTERPLEDDIDALAFLIGANASDVKQILHHLFFLHDGMWHHSRCDKEIIAFRERSEKAKKSAHARWRNADAMRAHIDRTANETILDANQEPVTNISLTYVRDKKPAKRASQLPVDFYPDETGITLAESLSVNLSIEIPKFMDYHAARGKPMKDWQAAWRTWARNAAQFSKERGAKAHTFKNVGQERADTVAILTGKSNTSAQVAQLSSQGQLIDGEARRVG